MGRQLQKFLYNPYSKANSTIFIGIIIYLAFKKTLQKIYFQKLKIEMAGIKTKKVKQFCRLSVYHYFILWYLAIS